MRKTVTPTGASPIRGSLRTVEDVPTPLPAERDTVLSPPDPDEVRLIQSGIVSACRATEGLTDLQAAVLQAVTGAMTGTEVDPTTVDLIEPDEFAAGLARRNHAFRRRVVQIMELGQMLLDPLVPEVARRVERFAEELSVDDECIHRAREVAEGAHTLAAVDFDRNRYLTDIAPRRRA